MTPYKFQMLTIFIALIILFIERGMYYEAQPQPKLGHRIITIILAFVQIAVYLSVILVFWDK